MKQFFSLLVLSAVAWSASSQSFRADVLDATTGKPVEAATVVVTGKGVVVTSDDGSFSLAGKNYQGSLALRISATGYEPKDTSVQASGASIHIYLTPQALLLQPVEVNAIRAGERSPFAKTNLNKAFIEKNNFGQDLPFILNQTPNVVVNSDAGNGIGYTGIRIRGSDATRINMTINGIPYNDAESQGTYFVDLPDFASSVSSIQIQRGVGTSSNGAGAFGASMNFSTNDYNDKSYVELNNSYGSFNSWKNTVKMGTGLLGKHFTFDGRFSNISSDGFIDRAKTKLQSGYMSTAYWGKKTAIRFNAIIGKEKTYQAWNGIPESDLLTNRTGNSAGTEKAGDPYDNETDNYWQNHFQLFWNQELSSNWKFNTAFFFTPGYGYYEQYKADQQLINYGLQPVTVGNTSYTHTDLVRRLWLDTDFFGQIFSFQQKKDKQQFTIGGGWNRTNGRHYGEVITSKVLPSLYTNYYDQLAYKTDVNIYAKWQQQLCRDWELFADLQYRYVDYKINGFTNNPDVTVNKKYGFVNPKIGASFRHDNWSGFISYAMANKEPNRDDFEAGITQQPKREQLHDFELNGKRTNVIDGLDLAATMYYMQYKDQLVLTGKINDVGAYTRSNIPNSFRAGIELEANYRASNWNAAYSISLSKNRIKNFTEYVDDYDNGGQQIIGHGNTDISFAPSIVQNITVNVLPVKDLELSWLGKHVGKQFLDNTSSESRSLDAFVVNDLRAAYTLHPKWLKEARLAFQLNNLFDVKYEPNGYTFSYISGGSYLYENYYFPMAGRNFMVALNIKL
ncbi:MAG: TonB-dependent receptor plug domain-containing protein [Chitinophagaceae bacterium]